MAVVLVHGVPDTSHVWDAIRTELGRDDVVALELPGFAGARPAGWGATKEDYLAWLVEQVEEVHAESGPVDLVGHDWGSLLTIRLTSVRGDLLRSWAAGNGPVDETYTWHETAQAWQTPEVGEQVMELMQPSAMVPTFLEAGHDQTGAEAAANAVDADMKSCILDLYRSAVDVGAEWGPDVDAIDTPGAVLWAQHDPFVPAHLGARLADRTGATLVELDSGHWWPLGATDAAAAALRELWASLD